MEHVTAFLVIFSTNFAIQSLPIEKGFSLNINPISVKEEVKPKNIGSLFSRISQDFKAADEVRRDVLPRDFFPQKSDLPLEYTNQVTKLIFPKRYFYDSNNTRTWPNHVIFLNLPIVRQPFDEYKILVATAPPNVRLGGDSKRTVIYVVFPEDATDKTPTSNIPMVYFINEKSSKMIPAKNVQVDPILIVDNNRTVTGLKSKEVSKFISFKNKWTNRYNYRVTR